MAQMLLAASAEGAGSQAKKRIVLVKIETCDRAGQPLHQGQLEGEFPDRRAAVAAIKLHLQQFEQAGYDRRGGYWWGRSLREPCEETRFFVK